LSINEIVLKEVQDISFLGINKLNYKKHTCKLIGKLKYLVSLSYKLKYKLNEKDKK